VADKIRILFLAANPKDATKLRLDEEIREIHSKIRAAEFRDAFELVSRWAIRPLDLLQALNEVQPHIVHFSGHGSRKAELVLEDNEGNTKPVTEAALVSLFKNVKDNVRLLLLNACHSESQARAISQQIECTVGMNVAIGDEAAIVFASTFYGALAFGRSVGQAFEQGRTALMLQGIPEENTPVLLTRPGADALTVSFVNRRPINPVLPPIALEILRSAVDSNSPINFVRYDGGVAVLAGANQFDCKFDLEQAALLEHAITMLIQVGWLKPRDEELHYVTQAGYEAAHKLIGQPRPSFLQVKEQMPGLIAEIKKDLEGNQGKFVREFFVMSKRHMLGGSEKPRFVYYEEDHENLRGMMDILENQGYLTDVTPGNVPIYRMSEEFVQLVLNHG
jgi:CHAT domain